MRRALLLNLLLSILCVSQAFAAEPREVDERQVARVGIRRVDSQYLTLYTDLPPHDAIDELGEIFDAAVPQWCSYFGVSQEKLPGWRVQGFLMQDRVKFAALELLPQRKPNFGNGYCQDRELWLMEQPSDYYRRHLLLHEGTHAFMYAFVDDDAPGWYMEGMAELLGTHHWEQSRLTLRHFPKTREETPMWGRIKIIRESKPLSVEAILSLRQGQALVTEQYAWCWALCSFLDSHPQWQDEFRSAQQFVGKENFNRRFRKLFADQWPDLCFEWTGFVATLDYGFDAQRMAMSHVKAPETVRDATCEISAERGWQSSGWVLQAGREYDLSATGRYTIAADNQPWPCEPGGVTLQYHDGQPLGKLIGLLRPAKDSATVSPPLSLGLKSRIVPRVDSILYLRVNEPASALSDNRGTLQVRCQLAADAAGGD